MITFKCIRSFGHAWGRQFCCRQKTSWCQHKIVRKSHRGVYFLSWILCFIISSVFCSFLVGGKVLPANSPVKAAMVFWMSKKLIQVDFWYSFLRCCKSMRNSRSSGWKLEVLGVISFQCVCPCFAMFCFAMDMGGVASGTHLRVYSEGCISYDWILVLSTRWFGCLLKRYGSTA